LELLEDTAFRVIVHGSANTFRIEAYSPEAADLTETSPLRCVPNAPPSAAPTRIRLFSTDPVAGRASARAAVKA